jgi:5'-nucleotidase
VSAYNALGYAAAAVGNHDFDFGPTGVDTTPARPSDDPRGALKARAAEAKFPFLAANLVAASTGRLPAMPNVKPSVIVTAASIKVGIIGVMTRSALNATMAANVRDLETTPLATAIVTEGSRLRKEGATVVIVAAHAGGRCTRFDRPADLTSCDPSSEIIEVARALPRKLVDVVVAGHRHAGMAHEVEGIAIVSSFSGGRTFGRVDLTVERRTGRATNTRIFSPRDLCAREDPKTQACEPGRGSAARVPARYEGKAVTPDAAIAKLLEPAFAQVRDLKARPLGVTLASVFPVRGDRESPIGNLFADAFRESIPGADIGLTNTGGGIRADLPGGSLTYGHLFEAFPFDNRIARVRITGRQLRQILTAHAQQASDLHAISGIRVAARCAGRSVVMELHRTSGAPVRDDERLTMVTSDFLATGSLLPTLPPQTVSIADDFPLARDVIADWLRRRGGTLREEQFVSATRPRWTYPGTLPIRCK